MKSELGSFGRVLDVFIEFQMPNYKDFHSMIEEAYDYEIAQRVIPHMSIICDGWKEVEQIIKGMYSFLEESVKPIKSNKGFREIRKLQATKIFEAYGKTNRSGYLFKLLDDNGLEKDDYKKLLYQVIKEPEEN